MTTKKAATAATRTETETRLPGTREELMALHRATRTRRNAAKHGSPEHAEAIALIGRIEIEIVRLERAMDPPRV